MIALLRKLLILLVLLLLIWGAEVLRSVGAEGAGVVSGEVPMVLGFSMLGAHLLGRLMAAATLPRITGYLLAGVLLGPHVLDFFETAVRDRLLVINQMALGIIALSAGGELALARLRPRLAAVGWITVLQTLLVFAATTGALLVVGVIGGDGLPLTGGLAGGQMLAMGLILGLIAVANSPASAVAVINETRARGPMTTVSLGTTVLKDAVVILLMSVTLSLASNLVDPGRAFEVRVLAVVLIELVASVGLGLMLGAALIAYLARVNREVAFFLLGAIFLTAELSRLLEEWLGLHPHFLLICMIAGFVVENLSERGEILIEGLNRSSLPIYVVFFTIAGVGLDLEALRRLWPLALVFVVWRGLLVYGTAWGGAWLAGESPAVTRNCWTAFLAQAGVSLGLVELVALRYPEFGARLKTLALAVIAINQLFGPILFERSLRKAGETHES